jgi:hypothetical protein
MDVGSDINVRNHRSTESVGLAGTGPILIGRLEDVKTTFVIARPADVGGFS